MRQSSLASQNETLSAPKTLSQLTKDILRGQVKDVTVLLRARSGPVTKAELEELTREIRKLDRPPLPATGRTPNPDQILAEIRQFGRRRQILADYRMILHEIRILQHRQDMLKRTQEQLTVLRADLPHTPPERMPSLEYRINVLSEALTRDTEVLQETKSRLKELCPLSLEEVQEMIKPDGAG